MSAPPVHDLGSLIIEEIRGFAEERGLLWGVCDAEKLEPYEAALSASQTPFVRRDVQARIDPKAAMPDARSLIVLGLCYGVETVFEADGAPRCELSAGALGEDYHRLLMALLTELAARLSGITPFSRRLFTDTGPLAERPLAHRAGLGFFGRNCSLISPERGSFFHIGYMLTSLELPVSASEPLTLERCRGCRKCVDACPAGALALGEAPRCDAFACVSYLTQKKGELTPRQRALVGLRLYGCDECQRVCPYNDGRACGKVFDIEAARPDIARLLRMTDEELTARFEFTAAGWRGAETLRRNARIALENFHGVNN